MINLVSCPDMLQVFRCLEADTGRFSLCAFEQKRLTNTVHPDISKANGFYICNVYIWLRCTCLDFVIKLHQLFFVGHTNLIRLQTVN